MDNKKFVPLAVTHETRSLLRRIAQKRRTPIYLLVQTMAEDAEKIFLPENINNDKHPIKNA